MPLGPQSLADVLQLGLNRDADGLCVIPHVDPKTVLAEGEASITLRLGRWFAAQRLSRRTHLDMYNVDDGQIWNVDEKVHFVPFGDHFVLHPGHFVLGVTLEWIAVPGCLSATVGGKSYIGRRGLIIETAAGIHPHFSGCLTLELANVGEVPMRLRPGMPVCQLFVERLDGPSKTAKYKSRFAGKRRPSAGPIKSDNNSSRLTDLANSMKSKSQKKDGHPPAAGS